ncbi:hypothetical protein DM867_04820 [Halosegnis rubeus]|jgi:hypothetical protein|uniref:Uncharacterized protein n=1 Tax=Halosegnis rubeus TaxID=2212850 RepID=A0A5N5UFI9_9EURY|nr:hypothetical protein [Halosegnis rubeus]KAB7516441.1 hypothetical protein DM867_04820 [Halosegnis rubeus]
MKRSTAVGVALAVLLAAVGTAALVTYTADDYLDGRELSVELNATDTGELVTVGHEGGDTLDATNTGALRITVTNTTGDTDAVAASRRIETTDPTFPFAASNTTSIHAPDAESGMRVTVVWVAPTNSGGEQTFLETAL